MEKLALWNISLEGFVIEAFTCKLVQNFREYFVKRALDGRRSQILFGFASLARFK